MPQRDGEAGKWIGWTGHRVGRTDGQVVELATVTDAGEDQKRIKVTVGDALLLIGDGQQPERKDFCATDADSVART